MERKAFDGPIMTSQSFTESMPLDYELNKASLLFFLVLFFPFGRRGWLELPGVGYFLSPS